MPDIKIIAKPTDLPDYKTARIIAHFNLGNLLAMCQRVGFEPQTVYHLPSVGLYYAVREN